MGRRQAPRVVEGIRISGIADQGRCVGRDAEGQVYFVDNTAPGDVVDVLVLKKKKGVFFGVPRRFVTLSPDRTEPFCRHFAYCGGCKWQHISYEAQLREKDQVVRDAFHRIGHLTVGEWEPILGAPETTFYRNKLEFGCANRRWLPEELLNTNVSNEQDVIGFHRAGAYDKIIDIEECWLQPEPSNAFRNEARRIAKAQDLAFFDMRNHHGLLRQMVVRTSTIGQTMVIFAFFQNDEKRITAFLDAFLERFTPLVQALREALTALSTPAIRINVIGGGVGGITESDATLAATSKATIIGFNVRADASARKVIEGNGVDLRYFSIIYDVIDQVKQVASGILGVEIREEIIGIAEVRDVFRSSKFGAVAGCMVVEGVVKKNKPIRVLRDNTVVFEGELESLRRFKENVDEVRNGTECGIGVKQYNDVKPGDQIECFERIEVQRTL